MSLDPVGLLHDTVAIPSVSGSEDEVAQFLRERCAAFADRSCLDPAGNVVVEVGRGPLAVMVLGHIDTVAGEVAVRIEGGRLYGRGSVDAKGPLCCALAAAERLSAAARNALRVTVIGAVEEEATSSRGARYLLDSVAPPDLLIIAEPSGWQAVTLGYKGRLLLSLHAAKPNRHSAEDEATAAADIVEAWTRIATWVDSQNAGVDRLFERVQLSLASIGSSEDGLVQRAEARIGFRLPPRLPPRAVEAALKQTPLPASMSLAFSGHELPYRGGRDTALTRVFRSAIRAAGGRPVTKLKTGTSDMNVVAPHWQVPMLAYGPGDSRLDHTPDEHVELDEFHRAVAVLTDVLERLARGRYRPASS